MTIARRRLAVIIAIFLVGIVGLLVGFCAWVNSHLGDRKDDRVLILPGDAPLTEQQAIDLAQQVLILDGRDVVNLDLTDVNYDTPATQSVLHRSQDGRVHLQYLHRNTRWWWYVELRREPGRVVGSSIHGL